MQHTDFAQYAEAVASALFGEPREKRGNEWRYGNHGSLAIQIDAGTWYDHEQKLGGGILDLIQRETDARTPRAAIRWLETQGIKPEERPPEKIKPKIVQTYDYIDEHGELRYQVCRMEPKSFRQRRPDGSGWSWSVKDVPPLPYRLPDILAKPSHTILIVEGEKDADALAALGFVATCNSGGAGKFPDDLLRWFAGRSVCILPDNDDAGRAHRDLVASKLLPIAESVRVVDLPDLPPKGDASDWLAARAGTSETDLRRLLIAFCRSAPAWTPPAAEPEPPPHHDDDQPLPPPPDNAPPPYADEYTNDARGVAPFRPLGFDQGAYYFLPHKTQQIVSIGAGGITSGAQLLQLAGLEWFEQYCPGRSGGVDWLSAGNMLIRWCEQRGTLDPANIRGRGAWFDAGRSVLHLGNRLLVDRQPVALHAIESRYIYQRQPDMESDLPEPLTTEQASTLHQIAQAMNWQRDVDRLLFIGAILLAPICGALAWRPHIWITAQRGSGKSWALDNILSPLVGGNALVVQGASTEAGIRQQLQHDARPILFDEAEGESPHARTRMQNVVELARQASGDGLAQIAKGTAGGKALTYRVRSMFLMSSINVGLNQAADKSRFTVLTLGRPESGPAGRQQFERLMQIVDNTLTVEWCARFRSRTYGLIPTIRANAATFTKVAGERIGNQRAGDQIGTLLAGAYAVLSDAKISTIDAAAYVDAFDWSDQTGDKKDSDESTLLAEIMHAQIKIETQHGSGKTRSVAELVQFLMDGNDADLTNDVAHSALLRHGLRVRDDRLLVAESHPELRKLLASSAWAGGWARILERVEGAEKIKSVRFAGVYHRAVSVPVNAIFGE